MKSFLTFIVIYFSLTGVAAESTVTIPLTDYMGLLKQSEPEESFTSVEDIRVAGTHGKRLAISIAGTATKKPQSVDIMPFSKNFRISNCKGSANLSVSGAKFLILPSDKKFKLSCEIFVNDWQKPLALSFVNTVSAQVNIEGAEATMIPGAFGFNYSILPKDRSPATVAGVKPTVKAYYKLTLSKEDNRFEYQYEVFNPNTSVVDFDLLTPNNETVSKVSTQSKYTKIEGGYKIALKPGVNRIWILGAFQGDKWSPSPDSQLSYLLLDQHPLISTKIQSKARQVSPRETKMRASYPAPKAFLLSEGEAFKWTKSELDAFIPQSYSVEYANYHYYWSPKGTSLVEASFQIQNQSATEFALDIPGTPTYLAINGAPLNLTKNQSDQLVVKLRPNQHQRLEIQYQVKKNPSRIFASVSEDLVRPATTISNTQLIFTTPENHKPLWYSLASDSHWFSFWSEAAKSLLVLFALWFLLQRFKIRGFWGRILPFSLSGLVFLLPYLFPWSFLGCLLLVVWSYRDRLSIPVGNLSFKNYALLAIFAIFFLVFWRIIGRQESMLASGMGGRQVVSANSFYSAKPGIKGSGIGFGATQSESRGLKKSAQLKEHMEAPKTMGLLNFEEDEVLGDSLPPARSAVSDETYKGLPSKIRMPSGGVQHVLEEKLSSSEEKLRFSAFTISKSLTNFFILLLACSFLLSIFKLKNEFLVIFRTREI